VTAVARPVSGCSPARSARDGGPGEDGRSGSAGRYLSPGFGPVVGREVGDERAQVDPVWELPVELGQ
jgi:hypothetical protein